MKSDLLIKFSFCLFFVFLIGMIIYRIFDLSYLKYVATIAGLLLFSIEIRYSFKNDFVIFFIGLALLCGLILEIVVTDGFRGINAFFMVTANIGITLFLLHDYKEIQTKFVRFVFYLSAFYFVFLAFNGVNPNNALVSASRNHISVLMLFLCCLYYIMILKSEKSIPILPALLTFSICLWAISRGGIISSGVFLGGFVIHKFKKNFIGALISVILILLVITYIESIKEYFNFFPKSFSLAKFYDRQLFEGERLFIIKNYITYNDWFTFLFGFCKKSIYDVTSTGNLHNSYLSAHSRLGFFSIFIWIMVIYSILSGFINAKKSLYSLMLVSVCIRAFTDTILLPAGIFDYILYYLIGEIVRGNCKPNGNKQCEYSVQTSRLSTT